MTRCVPRRICSELGRSPLGFNAHAHAAAVDTHLVDGLSTGLLAATTLVRVAQTLSSELDLDQLLGKLMRAALENAGAQRGVLVLVQAEGLRLEATLTTAPEELRLGLAQPLDASAPLASSVVVAVARTQDAVVLSNAAEDASPVLRLRTLYGAGLRHRPVPGRPPAQVGAERGAGVLYLENAATAAIAIDNAGLFAQA